MLDGFERFAPPAERGLTVTISTVGALHMNHVAYLALGAPSHIVLYCHPARRLVALQPATVVDLAAYPVRRLPRTQARAVSAMSFLRHFGIPFGGVSRVLPAEITDGVLLFPVETEHTP